jgi:hypothetical protein
MEFNNPGAGMNPCESRLGDRRPLSRAKPQNSREGMNPKTLQYLMDHSDISVTMNTYTHLGLEDAENELRRLSEINSARVELDRLNGTDFSIESNVKFG